LIIPGLLTRALRQIRSPATVTVIGNIVFLGKNRDFYVSEFKRFSKIIAEKRYVLIEKQ
jgi:hypothetical protein